MLQALRVTKKDGFDRLVFEFRQRVPGYRLGYVDRPARDCDSGQTRRVEGNARLELQLLPAQAHTADGEPTLGPRELKPALQAFLTLPKPSRGRKTMIVNYEQMMLIRKQLGFLDLEGGER